MRSRGLIATTLPSVDRRSGMLFTGHGLQFCRQVTDVRSPRGRTITVSLGFGTSNGDGGQRGSVTAIDRRGYYLTAAHAVGGDPIWVCCGGVMRSARVVFRGDSDFDVAVLSVDRSIPDAFAWADAGQCVAGTPVLQSGPSDPLGRPSVMQLLAGHTSTQLFAGRVYAVEDAKGSDGGFQWVTSSLPTRGGDSGGPVMTTEGALVAISVQHNPFYPRSYAVRPNPAWVRRVVEQDYIAYRSTSPTTNPS